MFFMRVGLGEILVCGVLIFVLIVIPFVLYWKTQRLGKGE